MNAIALPVLLPFATAVLLPLMTQRFERQRALSLISGLLLLGASVVLFEASGGGRVLTLNVSGWSPSVGITWVVDRLSALMLILTSILSLASIAYAPRRFDGPAAQRFYFTLHQFLLVGVNGSFITGDLFNLFVFFEIMLLASFVQLTLDSRRENHRDLVPYVLVNLGASMLLLLGVGMIYAGAGTVNLAAISRLTETTPLGGVFWMGLSLTLFVIAVKAAVAPVFSWLPDSYPAAPLVVSAFFAGVLTKVGVYVLYRVVPLVHFPLEDLVVQIILVVSLVTMLLGVLGALGSSSIRAILSFHIISQVGYMVLALGLMTASSLAAGILYIGHYMLVKTALFFAGGAAERIGSCRTTEEGGGLIMTHPFLAWGFFVPAMALAGMPPLSGFWGKFFLIKEALLVEAWWSAGISLVVSLLTLASMMKIWNAFFWRKSADDQVIAAPKPLHRGAKAAILGLATLSVVIGLAVAPLHQAAQSIAGHLLATKPYTEAVLGVPAEVELDGEIAQP
jgi:multicomponent Na+:H+ antiporter subunit D